MLYIPGYHAYLLRSKSPDLHGVLNGCKHLQCSGEWCFQQPDLSERKWIPAFGLNLKVGFRNVDR